MTTSEKRSAQRPDLRVQGVRLVSVVVPTLNEGPNIDPLLEAVFEAGSGCAFELEVIVVDDGSTDATRERVRAWTMTHRVRLLCRDGERGLAQAVLAGAAHASGHVVVVMDADLSHPPETVPVLASLVLDGSADMAIGSRYVSGGNIPGWPLRRRIISRGAAVLAAPLTDARDPLSGFFAVERTVLLGAGRGATGFKIGFEVLARSGSDLRVVEVPITFRDRTRGESKLGMAATTDYLRQLAGFAGAAVSKGSLLRLGVVALLGACVDFALFRALLSAGLGLGIAHILSFAAATVVNGVLSFRWALAGKVAAAATPGPRGFAAFVFTALLALLLRGGVLATLTTMWGWTPAVAIAPAILAAAAVNGLGWVFFAFARGRESRNPAAAWKLAFVGIGLYLLALRVAYAGSFFLLPQEAYYWNYSEHLDIGYLDHPPMVAWIIRAGTALFGQVELAVRAGSVLASLVTIGFAYLLARNLFGRTPGFVAALLAAALPFFLGTGLLMTPDAPLVACWAGALCFFERAILGERRAAWWGAGVCVGLGMLSKYTIALVPLSALLYCLVDKRARRTLLRPEPYGAALLALLIFSPVILWNVRNDWASFVYQGPRRWSGGTEFRLHTLVGELLVLITPLGLWGFVEGVRRAGKARLFGLVFTLVPFGVFLAWSFRGATKLNWSGPPWLAALPFMALSVLPAAGVTRTRAAQMLGRAWKPVLLALLLGYGLFLHVATLGLPGIPHPGGYAGVDWRGLGSWVNTIAREVESRTGARPLVVGMDRYNLASELAFYDPEGDGASKTAGQGMFGKRGLMYDRWFPPDLQGGKSLVLVSDEAADLDAPAVRGCVERLEPVQELIVSRNGAVGGRFYARVAHGYDPSRRPRLPLQ